MNGSSKAIHNPDSQEGENDSFEISIPMSIPLYNKMLKNQHQILASELAKI